MTIHSIEVAASVALQAAFVVLVADGLARTARAARAQDQIWKACQIALALLPLASLTLPHLRLFSGSAGNIAAIESPPVAGLPVVAGWLWTVWMVGAAALSARLLLELWRIGGVSKRSIPLPAAVRDDLRARLRDRGNPDSREPLEANGRRVEILVCRSLTGPACWQLHHPRIVLPSELLSYPREELALVVRHELAHLQLGHPLHLFLQRLVEIVFWIHPAVWRASRQAARAREFACDDAANDSRASAAVYVRALLRTLAGDGVDGPTRAIAPGFGSGRRLAVERVERLASTDWPAPPGSSPGRGVRIAVLWGSAAAAMLALWTPLDPAASRRSLWSPWPGRSAAVLHRFGAPVRDYEVDGHRLNPAELRRQGAASPGSLR